MESLRTSAAGISLEEILSSSQRHWNDVLPCCCTNYAVPLVLRLDGVELEINEL